MKKRVKMHRILTILIFLSVMVPMLAPVTMVQAKKSKSKNYWPKLSEEITAGAAILMDVQGRYCTRKISIRFIIRQVSLRSLLRLLQWKTVQWTK